MKRMTPAPSVLSVVRENMLGFHTIHSSLEGNPFLLLPLLFQHLCADELCRLCHMGRKQFPSMPISSSPLAWLCFACPIFAGSTQSGKGQSRWDLLSWVTQSFFLQVNLIFPTIYIICSILVTLVPMMASPKETGERVNLRIFQLMHRHWMCHHCQWNPRLLHPCVGVSFEETGLSTAILRSELAFWQKTICFPPSQHNNRVAEAVCGGDAGEKIGLKFNEHCTTWSRCTRWQIILAIMSRTWINLPISGKNRVSQTWHENLSSFQGCFPTNSGTSKPSNIKLVNCRTYQWQTFI